LQKNTPKNNKEAAEPKTNKQTQKQGCCSDSSQTPQGNYIGNRFCYFHNYIFYTLSAFYFYKMARVSSILAKIHQQLYKNTTDNNEGADACCIIGT